MSQVARTSLLFIISLVPAVTYSNQQGIAYAQSEESFTTAITTSTSTATPTAPSTAAPKPFGVCPHSIAPFNGIAARRRIVNENGQETVASFIFSVNPTTPTAVLPEGATTHCDDGSEFYVSQFDPANNGECVIDGLAIAEARAPAPIEGGCRYYFTRDDALDAEEKREGGMYELEEEQQREVLVQGSWERLPPALTSSQHTTVVDVLCEPDASLPSYYSLQLDAERPVTMIDYTGSTNRTFTVIKGYSYWSCASHPTPSTSTSPSTVPTTSMPTSSTEVTPFPTSSTEATSSTTTATTTETETSPSGSTTPSSETSTTTPTVTTTTGTQTSTAPSSSTSEFSTTSTSTTEEQTTTTTTDTTTPTSTTTTSVTSQPSFARAIFVTSLWERELEEAIRAAIYKNNSSLGVSHNLNTLVNSLNKNNDNNNDLVTTQENEGTIEAECEHQVAKRVEPHLYDVPSEETGETTTHDVGHKCRVSFSSYADAERAVVVANKGAIPNVYSAEMDGPSTTTAGPQRDDDDNDGQSMSKGAVVGIVFAVLIAVAGAGVGAFLFVRRKRRNSAAYDLNEAINVDDDTVNLGSRVNNRGYY